MVMVRRDGSHRKTAGQALHPGPTPRVGPDLSCTPYFTVRSAPEG